MYKSVNPNARNQGTTHGFSHKQGLTPDSLGGIGYRWANKPQNYQDAVKPAHADVLEAVRNATGSTSASSSLTSIFSIYNFVVRNIRYARPVDIAYIKPVHSTLILGLGECKSISVLLASMLESIGVKTIFVRGKTDEHSGHILVGVVVSDLQDDQKRKEQRQMVAEEIRKRYAPLIHLFHGGDGAIRFMETTVQGRKCSCLLLDGTLEHGIPGKAPMKLADIEYFESRPGTKITIPTME